MSARLPKDTIRNLAELAREIDERLQADGHKIAIAMGLDPAFNEGYVESALLRSIVASVASASDLPALDLANGGRDVIVADDDVHRVFRLRKAERDAFGLRVMASSDSIFSTPPGQRSLFPTLYPSELERWVLALIFNDDNTSLVEVTAALPIDFRASRPGRLLFDADQFAVPLKRTPPPFFPGTDDDLDLPDEGEEGDAETG